LSSGEGAKSTDSDFSAAQGTLSLLSLLRVLNDSKGHAGRPVVVSSLLQDPVGHDAFEELKQVDSSTYTESGLIRQ
jgi:hypothetical protein